MELGQFRMDVADPLGVKSMVRITQAAMGTQNARFATFFVGHPKAIGVIGRLGANEHQRSTQKRKNSGARHHFSEFFKRKNKKFVFSPKEIADANLGVNHNKKNSSQIFCRVDL